MNYDFWWFNELTIIIWIWYGSIRSSVLYIHVSYACITHTLCTICLVNRVFFSLLLFPSLCSVLRVFELNCEYTDDLCVTHSKKHFSFIPFLSNFYDFRVTNFTMIRMFDTAIFSFNFVVFLNRLCYLANKVKNRYRLKALNLFLC